MQVSSLSSLNLAKVNHSFLGFLLRALARYAQARSDPKNEARSSAHESRFGTVSHAIVEACEGFT